MKKIISLVVFLPLFLIACNKTSTSSVEASGKVTAYKELKHDWGEINIKGGKVTSTFTLVNGGEKDLFLRGAFTSCMCTVMKVTLPDGTVSPEFGMNNNPTNWIKTVKPGEEFFVDVTFDPMAHGPEAVGPIMRTVSLISSAKADGVYSKADSRINNGTITQLVVSGNVLFEEDYKKKSNYEEYSIIIGDFAFVEEEFDFGVVKQSQDIVFHDFSFQYNGQQSIKVTGVPTSCACTTASIDKNELKSGDEGVITVKFDPNLHEEPEGKFFKSVFLLTDPELDDDVEIKIWVEMDLDLGPEAYKQKEHDD